MAEEVAFRPCGSPFGGTRDNDFRRTVRADPRRRHAIARRPHRPRDPAQPASPQSPASAPAPRTGPTGASADSYSTRSRPPHTDRDGRSADPFPEPRNRLVTHRRRRHTPASCLLRWLSQGPVCVLRIFSAGSCVPPNSSRNWRLSTPRSSTTSATDSVWMCPWPRSSLKPMPARRYPRSPIGTPDPDWPCPLKGVAQMFDDVDGMSGRALAIWSPSMSCRCWLSVGCGWSRERVRASRTGSWSCRTPAHRYGCIPTGRKRLLPAQCRAPPQRCHADTEWAVHVLSQGKGATARCLARNPFGSPTLHPRGRVQCRGDWADRPRHLGHDGWAPSPDLSASHRELVPRTVSGLFVRVVRGVVAEIVLPPVLFRVGAELARPARPLPGRAWGGVQAFGR